MTSRTPSRPHDFRLLPGTCGDAKPGLQGKRRGLWGQRVRIGGIPDEIDDRRSSRRAVSLDHSVEENGVAR